jgi:TonB family protein
LQHRDALARLEWAQPPRPGRGRATPPADVAQNADAKKNDHGVSAGSTYALHAEGPLAGADVRPALPIRGSDPQVFPWELREEGDVIVEITIDEAGNIIEKRVLHSMSPAIDQKVLLALESWHFHPATRDGIPIPSKQDVHYHFKPS